MKPRIRTLLIAIAVFVLPTGGGTQGLTRLGAVFPEGVITAEGKLACHRLRIYLALDHTQRARGLMYVTELAPDRGMLFLYPEAGIVSMWMKNTLIPLDMIFIRPDGTVANIASGTTPLSLESIPAIEPVNAVLEVNAGVAAALGIAPERRIWVGQALAGAEPGATE